MSDDKSMGKAAGDATSGIILSLVDGKDPKSDALVGAGLTTFGVSAFAVATGAVLTGPAVLLALALGAGIGYFGGQNKKNRGG